MKIKKVICVIVSMLMVATLLTPLTCSKTVKAAEKLTYQDWEYQELEDETMEISGYNGSETEIVIPSEIDGKKVTSIGDYAFEGCSGLTTIEIPSGVTNIGRGPFLACSSLTNIIVEAESLYYSSVDGVLYNKDKTKIICCPGGKKGNFIIPSSITSIGIYAFYKCRSLTSIEIPLGVTSIESAAFSSCSSLINIEIPSSATNIDFTAFAGCSSLTTIEIPSGVTSISSVPFSECSSLTSIIVGAESLYYSSVDGVLYNKDKTEIIRCPEGKKGKVHNPIRCNEYR